jgi:hypothetical protein
VDSDEEEVDPFVSAEWLTSAESVTLPDPILDFFSKNISKNKCPTNNANHTWVH